MAHITGSIFSPIQLSSILSHFNNFELKKISHFGKKKTRDQYFAVKRKSKWMVRILSHLKLRCWHVSLSPSMTFWAITPSLLCQYPGCDPFWIFRMNFQNEMNMNKTVSDTMTSSYKPKMRDIIRNKFAKELTTITKSATKVLNAFEPGVLHLIWRAKELAINARMGKISIKQRISFNKAGRKTSGLISVYLISVSWTAAW